LQKLFKIKILLIVIVFSFWGLSAKTYAQKITSQQLEYSPTENLPKVTASEFISEVIEIPLKNAEPFIAIGLTATLYNNPISFYLRVSENGNDWSKWNKIKNDDEAGKIDLKFLGTLQFFNKNSKFIQFKTNEYSNLKALTFSFISPGKTPKNMIEENIKRSRLQKSVAGLERPAYVNRKGWGCPQDENVSSRSLTNVTHLIIHHSAGNTVSSDYAAVVRSYWNYHVNSNGWADIGYNWLVDPNGVLYKGRAWKSDTQENVIGAHNSGKNGNTAGICFIGNYVSNIPSDAGLDKIAEISAFLCDKYNIDPEGKSYHAAIERVNDNITGHGQSGGGTSCPGTQIINRMQTIRELTASKIIDITAAPEVVYTYPNSEVDSSYLTKPIIIEFTHPMDKNSVETSYTISPNIFALISWNDNGNIFTITPSSPLSSTTEYKVTLSTDAKSFWEVPIAEQLEINFVTKKNDNLSLLSVYPNDGATDVELDVTVKLQFDGPLASNSLGGNVLFLDDEENNVSIRVNTGSYSDGIIEFYPTSNLTENKNYSIILKGGISTTDGYSFGIDKNITFSTKSLTSVFNDNTPKDYELISCYPNPFNPSTTIQFQIKDDSKVSIKIYDIIGNEITTLVNKFVKAGIHKSTFNAGNLPSGIYFSQIVTNNETKTIKLLLTK